MKSSDELIEMLRERTSSGILRWKKFGFGNNMVMVSRVCDCTTLSIRRPIERKGGEGEDDIVRCVLISGTEHNKFSKDYRKDRSVLAEYYGSKVEFMFTPFYHLWNSALFSSSHVDSMDDDNVLREIFAIEEDPVRKLSA